MKEGSRSSDLFYDQLAEDFEAGQASFDVFAADVVWTAAFAQNKWVVDLTEKFFDQYQPESFVKPAMESASYHYRIWEFLGLRMLAFCFTEKTYWTKLV